MMAPHLKAFSNGEKSTENKFLLHFCLDAGTNLSQGVASHENAVLEDGLEAAA